MRHDTRLLGIDEAGRGPLMGPMVVCGVLVRAHSVHKLLACGVKDSKLLSASRREKLQPFICNIADSWRTVEITPSEIDAEGLTRTGFQAIVHLICTFRPDIAIIDAPTAWPDAYCQRLRSSIGSTDTTVVVAPKADVNHPVVAAASILAKLTRDERIHELSIEYGNIGSGYPSDKTTISFLRQYIEVNHHLPAMVRTRWITVKRFMQIQSNLD